MTERAISGVFAIATLALILLNANNLSSIIKTGGGNYATLVKGLQGR